jgi:superfamily I DNA/RNA helicase
MHWFVDNFALYTGSVRGLFISDFSPEYDAYIESSVINLRARGIEPFLTNGDQVVAQSEALWAMATSGTPFNQPHVSMYELDMLRAEVAIIKDLEAPVTPSQLWYLYHYIIYPRALFNKATVVTTSLGLDEFNAYGAECEDFEYSGRKLSWEKLMWLVEATMIDLYQFRQVKTDGHPPMLKAEYNLFNAMNERGLPVIAQQVLGDYMLDMSIADRDNRLAIECDVLASLDPNVPNSGEAKKNLVLLSDGWKILRFTTAEILGDLTACVDAVEQVWTQGRKKSAVGRLMSGRDQPKIPELPVDDDSQKLAITHGAGPVAVTGGAGTGKTSTVSHRIGYLLAQGVCPERILVFSHSEETVAQLKRKVEVLTDAQTVQRINFSDWKDLGLRILKENAVAVKRKPPLKLESAPHRVLQRVLKKEMKDMDPLQLELMEADIDEVSIGLLISLYKANLITPERIKEKATTDAEDFVAKLYSAYEDALRKSNKVDPDDTIFLVAQLLADDPEVRAKYQHKYEYVLVDEYQDCTVAADLMARLLAFPQDNLFLVGDEDECVTEGKGAMPRMLADTSIRMPNARCYVLDKNWRSHPAIVDHSRSLASALSIKGIIKDMLPGYGTAATSAVIGPQQCRTEEAEADWVANEVSILIESGKSLNDIIVLWRNQRYSSLLEAALFKRNIKCVSANAASESVPDEVGDVMAFLRLVMDPDGPKARASFERFCQLKSREMDQKLSRLSNTIASFAEANNLSFLKAIEIYHDATADSSCEDLAQLVRIVRTMNQEGLPPAQTIGLLKRTQKLNEIYAAVKVPPGVVYEPMRKVEQLEEEAKGYTSVREFVKAKQEYLENKESSTDETSIQLKSFEDAKGFEYPITFMTGMAEGLCPSDQAPNYEEERRLCYVAMTRAKELLYISYPATFEEKPVPPSPFLVEARLLPINVYRKAVDLIQHQLPAKPAAAAEPAAPASGMLTPIMTGRPERVSPAANRQRLREGAPGVAPGQGAPPPQGTAPGGAPNAQRQGPVNQQRGGNRPGSDVADLIGGRIAPPGGGAINASGAQPIIRPAGHSANLAKGGTGIPVDPNAPVAQAAPGTAGQGAPGVGSGTGMGGGQGLPGQNLGNPFVGLEADQTRVIDESRQRAENEAKLKAQYESHIIAQQQAATQAELEAQRRAEQDAYLRARHEQALREQQEAVLRAQQEESLRRAQEEAARKEQNELRLKAEREAEIRAQHEAELQAQREAALRAQQEMEQRARQQAELRAQEEAQAKAEEAEMFLLVQQEAARRAREEEELRAQEEAQAQLLAQQQADEEARLAAEAQAQQEAELLVQQQAEQQAQRQAALKAEQRAQFEAQQLAYQQAQAEELAQQQAQQLAQQQAEQLAQQQAQQLAQQQAEQLAQQQAQQLAQQQAEQLAQQQAQRLAQQQAQQFAQQQAEQLAQQQAQQLAQQQAQQFAQQQAEYQAQQQAAAQAQANAQREAMTPEQKQAEFNARHDALLFAQQQADYQSDVYQGQNQSTQPAASHNEEERARQEAAAKAQQEALARVQEKAAQRAMVDLELRMAQEAALRNQQAPGPSEAAQTAPNAGPQPATSDINKLVDEQFNFAGVPITNQSAPAASQAPSDSSAEPVDPERLKQEELARSTKEAMDELSPAERSKQQDALRKKAREKLKGGRKKKGAVEAEPAVDAEPSNDVAPAAVAPVPQPPVPQPPVPQPPVPQPPVPPTPVTQPPVSEPPVAQPTAPQPTVPQPPVNVPAEPAQSVVQPNPSSGLPEQAYSPYGVPIEPAQVPPPAPAPVPAMPPAQVPPPAPMAYPPAASVPPNPYGDTPNPYGEKPNPYGDVPNPYGDKPNPYGDVPNPYGDAPNPYGVPQSQPQSSQHPLDAFSAPKPSVAAQPPGFANPGSNREPGIFGDSGMVGGPGSGVTVHPERGAGPAVPDFDQIAAAQQGSWNTQESVPPPAVAPPEPSPAQGGYPPVSQRPTFTSPVVPTPPQPVDSAPQFTPVVPKPAGLHACPQCSSPLEPNARFCGECGYHIQVQAAPPPPTPAPAAKLACPSCAEPLEPNARFCGECGHSLV